ncbi:hypothetical protein T492DRAFT_843121 [Pavlovales sp. CCMP2436]|nr:hypothetical protein T492DRAFT_843121 [Pavlovales sp. CCMP2436]
MPAGSASRPPPTMFFIRATDEADTDIVPPPEPGCSARLARGDASAVTTAKHGDGTDVGWPGADNGRILRTQGGSSENCSDCDPSQFAQGAGVQGNWITVLKTCEPLSRVDHSAKDSADHGGDESSYPGCNYYDHAQRTFALPVFLGLSSGAAFAAAVFAGASDRSHAAFVVGVVLLLSAQMIRKLRVAVARTLAWIEVVSATKVRNSWQTGLGIHAVSKGWLWNIAGPDAVELELRTGRVFCICTDDDDGLLAACKKYLR